MAGLLNNYDFLNALNYKQNYAAKEQAKQNEMALLLQQQNLRQQDMRNALARQAELDQTKAYVNSLPMLEQDKLKMQKNFIDMDKELKSEIDTKFNGNVNDFMNSYSGQQFIQKYKSKATNMEDLPKWTENKVNAEAINKAAASGMEVLPIYNEGKWYDTPEEQLADYQSGKIDKIAFSGAVKPKETDLQKYFASIIAPTATLDEARSNERAYASPQLAAETLMEKQYPMLQKGSEHYKRYYNKYFDDFSKQFEDVGQRFYYKPYQQYTIEEKKDIALKNYNLAQQRLAQGIRVADWRMSGGGLPVISSETPITTTFEITKKGDGDNLVKNAIQANVWSIANPKKAEQVVTYAYYPDKKDKSTETVFKNNKSTKVEKEVSAGERTSPNVKIKYSTTPTVVNMASRNEGGRIIPDYTGQGNTHTFVLGVDDKNEAVVVPYELSIFAQKEVPTSQVAAPKAANATPTGKIKTYR